MESDSICLCILIINTFNCSRKCSGQFQVAKADQGDDQKRPEESKKGDDDEQHSETAGGDNSEEHGSGWSSGESHTESDRESDEYVDEEIISPASCVIHFLPVKLCMTGWYSNENQRPQDNSDMPFFRRIHVICMDNCIRCVIIQTIKCALN